MTSPHQPTDLNSPPPESPAEKPSRLLWWLHPKVALPLTLLGLLLAAPFLYRGYRLSRIPDIGDPFDVEAFGTVDIGSNENAMNQYAVAATMQVGAGLGGAPPEDFQKAVEFGWDQASEPLRKHLAANEPALAEWRKGTELSHAVIIQPKDLRIESNLQLIDKLRAFSRLALLKADQCLFEGDVLSSWAWHRAAIRASRHLSQNGCLIQRLTGIATLRLDSNGVVRWTQSPRVNADQLRTAIADWLEAEKLAQPNSVALKCEYLAYQQLFRTENLQSYLGHASSMPQTLFRPSAFLLGEPLFSKRLAQHAFENWLSEIDKPRWQQAPQSPAPFGLFDISSGKLAGLPARELNARLLSPCFAHDFLPALIQANEAMQCAVAHEAALKLMLAGQLYFRLHGDWPAKLEDLVPEILAELPADPLGKSGETLRLKRDGDDLLIYSVGWNGNDDGGETIQVNRHPLDEGFRLKPPLDAANEKLQNSAPKEKN